MFRKRKQPTPHFKLPAPFQPITGDRAQLRIFGVSPYCAMMQIAADDTHDNYLLCRGFDIRIPKFIDYDAADLTNNPGIPVAKPYAFRRSGVYTKAQIYAAFLPLQIGVPSPSDVPWRVGQNPGYATVTPGHPADLNETVDLLKTDDGIIINWFIVEAPSSGSWYIGKMTEDIAPAETKTAEQHSQGWVATGTFFEVYNPHDVTLPSGLKVRWAPYPEWDGWIVEPWHYTTC